MTSALRQAEAWYLHPSTQLFCLWPCAQVLKRMSAMVGTRLTIKYLKDSPQIVLADDAKLYQVCVVIFRSMKCYGCNIVHRFLRRKKIDYPMKQTVLYHITNIFEIKKFLSAVYSMPWLHPGGALCDGECIQVHPQGGRHDKHRGLHRWTVPHLQGR